MDTKDKYTDIKDNYYFGIYPIIGIGYTQDKWVSLLHTVTIKRFHFLCFILTIYNYGRY